TRAEDGELATMSSAARAPTTASELPAWLRTPLPARPSAITLLRPSDTGQGGSYRARSLPERARSLQRGTLVHRLLQSLPDIPAIWRCETALNFLVRNAPGWSEPERVRLVQQVLTLIDEPRFAAVFADGSRAEVPIVGRLALLGRPEAFVSGQ